MVTPFVTFGTPVPHIARSELYMTGEEKLGRMNQLHAKMFTGESNSLFPVDLYTTSQYTLENGHIQANVDYFEH